jgi:hypothetical protein
VRNLLAHLAILDALGVRHAVLAVTRSDLADPEPVRADAVEGQTPEGRSTFVVRPSELAEDTRFELVRGCPQHAFQACALGL